MTEAAKNLLRASREARLLISLAMDALRIQGWQLNPIIVRFDEAISKAEKADGGGV